ncbi:MAG: ribosome biogenesis GTPase YlqF [Clostridia bacterium]|nr:ribosome biogenesis GTPase YlqF [Clostridia bacterium]
MNDNTTNINWFPGHMTKAKRKIAAQIKIVDAVAEIVDARIPVSSRNPDIPELIGDKPHILLLNKCDIADAKKTAEWLDFYKSNGVIALAVDAKSGKGTGEFKNSVATALSDKLSCYLEKGMVGRTLRVMVLGIPNVGKSSFINRMSGKSKAKVENRPGVTKGNQWFTVDKNLELLDTPGVLWPKFNSQTVGEHLAITGAVTDRILDIELLAMRLLQILKDDYMPLILERYSIDILPDDSYEALCAVGRKRGMIIRGGEIDTLRAANMLLEEFRNCKIGRITLEGVDFNA